MAPARLDVEADDVTEGAVELGLAGTEVGVPPEG